jgi:hypothetical protein
MAEQQFRPMGFLFAAQRSRFEITKFGMSETFFVFGNVPVISPESMAAFSDAAYRFAIQSKTVPLPCGFFESVWCFAVAVTAGLHPQAAEWIRATEPPKHWGSGEMRVVFDVTTGQLAYFDRTPVWGAAYYAGFRSQIQRVLA